jgi:hypothetical protein
MMTTFGRFAAGIPKVNDSGDRFPLLKAIPEE